MARRLAAETPEASSYFVDRLQRDLDVAVPRAEDLVAAESGIPAPPPVAWGIIGRADWAETNIAGMTHLLAPLSEKVGRRLESLPMPVRVAQRAIVSAEVGALLGYMARRVLGQYDLLFGGTAQLPRRVLRTQRNRGSSADGALYFVGQNMVETERRLGFVPEEFALWVALHEVTHRFQFAGVPWLRERFLSLVHAYLASVEMDASSMAARFAGGVRRLVAGDLPPEERNPVYLLASEDQRDVLNQIQALMAVVEGHGNFVMDSVGAQVIPSFQRMRHLFEARRKQTSVIQRAINHAIGLEMKLRQYELGQQFCNAVVERGGAAALGAMWAAPENLPTIAELREPRLWLQRIAA